VTKTSVPVRPSRAAHVGDGRGAGQRVADPDRRAEVEAAAGPHPPRQAHRRQEAAAARMAVGADLVARALGVK
jgi:hypothetical protein